MKKVKHHEIEYKQQMQLERHIIRTSQKNNKRNLTPLYPKSQRASKKHTKHEWEGPKNKERKTNKLKHITNKEK